MVQRPCPRCGAPCSVEQCPACGANVPPSAEAILAGGELLTHGRPEPETDAAPRPPITPPHGKDEADRTVEIPIIPADPAPSAPSAPEPVVDTTAAEPPAEGSSDRTLPVTGSSAAAAAVAPPVGPATGPSAAPAAGPSTGPGAVPAAPTRIGPAVDRPDPDRGQATPARRRRGPVVAVAAGTALVLLIGLVVALLVRDPGVDGVAQPAETVPSSLPPVTATVTESAAPSPTTVEITPSPEEPATSEPVAPPPVETPSSSPSSSAPAQPVAEDIACQDGGWIVQLASENDENVYAQRVAQLQAVGQVPEGAKTARTGGSCGIFTSQTNSIVLWAGPFPSQYDACPARWAGPPDAFVKATTPDLARSYVSCLCPNDPAGFPVLQTGSTDAVWIGELQRVLGNKLNESIADLQGNWGTYTPGTLAAVSAFQQKSGLPATGVVDTATWVALNAAQC